MSKPTPPFNPPFPRVICVDDRSRRWLRKADNPQAYTSEDGNFEVSQGNGYAVLASFIHEPRRGKKVWSKRFPTVLAAIEYAEQM